MNRTITTTDALPWYRQFWPWFLLALPGAVVIAGLTTLYIANRHADDLVVDEYYRDGLAINRQLERKQRADALGIDARPLFSTGNVRVAITGPVDAGTLLLHLSHPLEADRDFTVTLRREESGLYASQTPGEVSPHWHWILEAPGSDGWRLDGEVLDSDIDGRHRSR